MVIGIDLDGVTYDSQDIIRTAAEIYDVEHKGKGVVNPKSLYVAEKYDWTKDECLTFLKDIVWMYTFNAPLKPYAKYVIDYLHDQGHKIVFITARGAYSSPHEDVLTKKVLEKGWFSRGTKVMITGYRREDTFVAKTYKATATHQLYKIVNVNDSNITLEHERISI